MPSTRLVLSESVPLALPEVDDGTSFDSSYGYLSPSSPTMSSWEVCTGSHHPLSPQNCNGALHVDAQESGRWDSQAGFGRKGAEGKLLETSGAACDALTLSGVGVGSKAVVITEEMAITFMLQGQEGCDYLR